MEQWVVGHRVNIDHHACVFVSDCNIKTLAEFMFRLEKRLWRACCYFIILSVIFPDGNRSLLAFLSDLLAR